MTSNAKVEVFNDSGGMAPHKDSCSHVDEILPSSLLDTSDDQSSILNALPQLPNNSICSADKCSFTECWMCLTCNKILCGRYGNQHMMYHFQEHRDKHCLVLGINDLSFWCYGCSQYISHLTIEKVYRMYDIVHRKKFGSALPIELSDECEWKKNKSTNNTLTMLVISEEGNNADEDAKAPENK